MDGLPRHGLRRPVSVRGHTPAQARVVAAQVGRVPREPWRVASSCRWGHPVTIASPSRLADGTLFPTLFWLTCPHLAEGASALESAGEASRFAERAAAGGTLARELHATDARLREARIAESGGVDACSGVGLAGQRDPLGVKCLHAHVALEIAGIGDPIGREVIERIGGECADQRCARLAENEDREDR